MERINADDGRARLAAAAAAAALDLADYTPVT